MPIRYKTSPKRFAVSTGFVFDVHGAISSQMDIVIHDAEDCPVFTAPGEAKFFPCEGVLAVGQVKSNITSADEYEAALQNIRSAKRLDRSTRGRSHSTCSSEPIEHTENHLHQMFSFVFIINRCLPCSGRTTSTCGIIHGMSSQITRWLSTITC